MEQITHQILVDNQTNKVDHLLSIVSYLEQELENQQEALSIALDELKKLDENGVARYFDSLDKKEDAYLKATKEEY